MRKVILMAILLIFPMTCLFCQEAYRPMLTEGRSWVAVRTTSCKDMYPFLEDYEIVKTVSRDTVIDGHSCKIIENVRKDTGGKYETILLEEDRVIYWYDESKEFVRWMDFNLHLGDDIYEGFDEFAGGRYYVLSEDTVEVNGIAYRRLGIGHVNYGPFEYWVEGVGDSEWGLDDLPLISTMGIYTYMKACYENGECIFTKDDFYKEAAGIDAIQATPDVEDGAVYDLQGRRLHHTVPGINIVNGKKILTR